MLKPRVLYEIEGMAEYWYAKLLKLAKKLIYYRRKSYIRSFTSVAVTIYKSSALPRQQRVFRVERAYISMKGGILLNFAGVVIEQGLV